MYKKLPDLFWKSQQVPRGSDTLSSKGQVGAGQLKREERSGRAWGAAVSGNMEYSGIRRNSSNARGD